MKLEKHIKEANRIGADAWELMSFSQLPKNASRERQIQALKSDQKWLENHLCEINHSINRLIADIEQC